MDKTAYQPQKSYRAEVCESYSIRTTVKCLMTFFHQVDILQYRPVGKNTLIIVIKMQNSYIQVDFGWAKSCDSEASEPLWFRAAADLNRLLLYNSNQFNLGTSIHSQKREKTQR